MGNYYKNRGATKERPSFSRLLVMVEVAWLRSKSPTTTNTNVGALIIRIGLGVYYYYNYYTEPPK